MWSGLTTESNLVKLTLYAKLPTEADIRFYWHRVWDSKTFSAVPKKDAVPTLAAMQKMLKL